MISSSRRAVARAAAVFVAVACVACASELIGAVYLRGREVYWRHEIATQHGRVSAFRRATPLEPHVQQNAALWYRLAFANTTTSNGDNEAMRPAVTADVTLANGARSDSFQNQCREINAPRIRTALRCVFCDWEVPDRAGLSETIGLYPQAVFIGYCEILAGHVQVVNRTWTLALEAYLEALGYANDLDQGDYPMNIVAIGLAKVDLRAIANLVAAIPFDDPGLSSFLIRLDRHTGNLPTAHSGLQYVKVRLIADAIRRARGDERCPKMLCASSSAFVRAERLRQEEHLLKYIDEASTERSRDRRTRLAESIQRRLGWNSEESIADEIPAHWDSLANDADDLNTMFAAIQTAVEVKMSRAAHGEYPADVGKSHESDGILYRRTTDGFVLSGRQGADDNVVLIQDVR